MGHQWGKCNYQSPQNPEDERLRSVGFHTLETPNERGANREVRVGVRTPKRERERAGLQKAPNLGGFGRWLRKT